MSHFVQEQSGGGSGQGTFTTIGEMLNWNRLWTQELTTFLSGGANFKLPVGSDIPGQSQALQIRPTVTARMTYLSYSEDLRDAGSSEGPFDNYNAPSLASSLASSLGQQPRWRQPSWQPNSRGNPVTRAVQCDDGVSIQLSPQLCIHSWASAGACVSPNCTRGDHVQAHRHCGNELCP